MENAVENISEKNWEPNPWFKTRPEQIKKTRPNVEDKNRESYEKHFIVLVFLFIKKDNVFFSFGSGHS